MEKEMKATIILGLVILLIIPCITTNISATELPLEEIQKAVEDELEMELHLCYMVELTPGYDILFVPSNSTETLSENLFFETYYDGETIETTERYIEDSVYKESSVEIISLNPYVTTQLISFCGNITMEIGGLPVFLSWHHETTVTSFASVTSWGLIVCRFGKVAHVLDLSYQTHDWSVQCNGFDSYEEYGQDNSYVILHAIGNYYNPPSNWNVWACVKQWADYPWHWDGWGDYGPA